MDRCSHMGLASLAGMIEQTAELAEMLDMGLASLAEMIASVLLLS